MRFRRHGNVGQRGEDLAHRYLRRSGFTVVARNWRPPQGGGELDLVAWERGELVFIEVKSRASGERNSPLRDIDEEKLRALRRAARDYVRRAGAESAAMRFDVISIEDNALEHFRNAFPFTP
ncbi:MAG: YraN family protein [Acidobacteriota bacterium]